MPDSPELSHHAPRVIYAEPTPGVLEVEPSMAWNPAVLAGAARPLLHALIVGQEERCICEALLGGAQPGQCSREGAPGRRGEGCLGVLAVRVALQDCSNTAALHLAPS